MNAATAKQTPMKPQAWTRVAQQIGQAIQRRMEMAKDTPMTAPRRSRPPPGRLTPSLNSG